MFVEKNCLKIISINHFVFVYKNLVSEKKSMAPLQTALIDIPDYYIIHRI